MSDTSSNALSVSERLVAFARAQQAAGVPDKVLHEARRLVLNQMKASVSATGHAGVKILHQWATRETTSGPAAHILWFGTPASPAQASVVNGALFEALDFHDTYIPTFMHAVSAVLPAVLAQAEVEGKSGREFLTALALGLEIELAIATILMPTAYYRGFVPAGLVGGVGAAAACAILSGLDDARFRNAIGIAMCSAFGTYVSVGSMTLAYITGATARSGLTAFELAKLGMDAPRTGFEGDKGMLLSYSNESADKIEGVLDSLGATWRIFGQSYKTVPTETITHAPVEMVLELVKRANGRELRRMNFAVQPIVVEIADERRERFGLPDSENAARFDLRFCAAAAWVRKRFSFDEMQEPAYRDPAILDLRNRIDLTADPARKTFEGASLDAEFTDGSREFINVDYFLGTPNRPMTDEQLMQVFRTTAQGILPDGRADRIAEAIWSLDSAADLQSLVALARLG
jgi:2-methylcitrate dehydratase PrpD